jgi:hypothetical protein
MTRRLSNLLVPTAVVCAAAASARAAGVVGDGTPASCTEAALSAALAGGGTVTFACGSSPVTIPFTSEKVVTVSTTVDGGGLVTLSGQNATRLFHVPDAPPPGIELTVRGIRLGNGVCPTAPTAFLPGFGGAIAAGANARVALVDADVHGHSCASSTDGTGGAVHVRGGALLFQRVQGGFNGPAADGVVVNSLDSAVTIEDSVFTSNLPARRGQIVYADGGSVRLIGTRVLVAHSTHGGAVYGRFGPGDGGLSIDRTRIMNAQAGGDGGAVYAMGGPLRITASTIASGWAYRGGAVFAQDVALDVSNATIYANRVDEASPGDGSGFGGAFYLAGLVTGTISHSTLVANTAQIAGASFAGTGTSPLALRATLLSSFAGNTVACSIGLASGGFNIQSPEADADCAPGILRADPGLAAYVFDPGYFPLAPTSPARDLVTSGCPPPAVDQIGTMRPKGPRCDAGSYEWAPLITVEHAERYEGNAGAAPMTFTVRLSAPSVETVTVAYSTGPEGDATPGVDYLSAAGVVTFPPGVVERTVDVSILGDAIQEPSEPFTFRLSAPNGGVLGTVATYGTIIDDDWPPTISVVGCDADEGDPSCRFRIHLNLLNGAPVTVQYATASGSATAGEDFQPVSGTVTFLPGSFEAFVDVPILQDVIDEPTEVYTFQLSAPQNGTLGVGAASGGIRDDDGPFVSIGDVSTFEGDSGQHIVNLTVTLSAPSVGEVIVSYGPAQGTALPGLDYLQAGGQVTIAPGALTATVAAVVLGDTLDEPDERFYVRISAQGATALGTGGIVTIRDDDGDVIRVGELSHGSSVRSDLAAGEDVYVLTQPGYTSWEAVVDESSGDLGTGAGPVLQRVAPDLSTVEQHSSAAGVGPARVLRWANAEPFGALRASYLRVASQGCGTGCGPEDVYRIRVYDTTLRAPRFNCVGGQSTALVLQNAGDADVGTWISAWAAGGSSIPDGTVAEAASLGPHEVRVVSLCGLPGLAGRSGSLTVAHDGSYGQLVGKVVSVDPATGASFDTPLTARPR